MKRLFINVVFFLSITQVCAYSEYQIGTNGFLFLRNQITETRSERRDRLVRSSAFHNEGFRQGLFMCGPIFMFLGLIFSATVVQYSIPCFACALLCPYVAVKYIQSSGWSFNYNISSNDLCGLALLQLGHIITSCGLLPIVLGIPLAQLLAGIPVGFILIYIAFNMCMNGYGFKECLQNMYDNINIITLLDLISAIIRSAGI